MDNPAQEQVSSFAEPQSALAQNVVQDSATTSQIKPAVRQNISSNSKSNWTNIASLLLFISLLFVILGAVFYIGEQQGINQGPRTIGDVFLSIPKSLGIQVGLNAPSAVPTPPNLVNQTGEAVLEGRITGIAFNAQGGILSTDIPSASQITVDMSTEILGGSESARIPITIDQLKKGDAIGMKAIFIGKDQWRAVKITLVNDNNVLPKSLPSN